MNSAVDVQDVAPPVIVTVPDLHGDDNTTAGQALDAVGLSLGHLPEVPNQNCDLAGVVVNQNPNAGSQVPLGTTVSIALGAQPKSGRCQ
jgi:beta-lactam-binding protein with PASTA domain